MDWSYVGAFGNVTSMRMVAWRTRLSLFFHSHYASLPPPPPPPTRTTLIRHHHAQLKRGTMASRENNYMQHHGAVETRHQHLFQQHFYANTGAHGAHVPTSLSSRPLLLCASLSILEQVIHTPALVHCGHQYQVMVQDQQRVRGC